MTRERCYYFPRLKDFCFRATSSCLRLGRSTASLDRELLAWRVMINSNQSSVIAFAGRRTDEENAEKPRFPFEKVSAVRETLTALFLREQAVGLVASGACGSDLTALAAARAIGIRSRIVLPFWSDHFRQTSVVDRPHAEYWGALFDRVTDYAKSRDDLVCWTCKKAPNRHTHTSIVQFSVRRTSSPLRMLNCEGSQ